MSSSPPRPSLRIAIVGPGRIGSTFAFYLATAGHEVTVVARAGSPRLQQLRQEDAIVTVDGRRAAVRVLDRLDEETPYDLVIVTLLAHQAGPMLPVLKRSAAGCVQFMFNTFDPEHLQAAIGQERCALGMPFVQATLDADGRLKASVGAAGQKTLLGEQQWVDVFNAAGLPAKVERDMSAWLRCHAPMCVAFESVSIAGIRRGGGASWREAAILARGIHASFGLIRALGHPIYPGTKRFLDRSPIAVLAAMLWSISRVRSFRDLLATGQAECEALIGGMISAAPSTRIDDVSAIEAMRPVEQSGGRLKSDA